MIWLGAALLVVGVPAFVLGSAANQRADMGVRWGRPFGLVSLAAAVLGLLIIAASIA